MKVPFLKPIAWYLVFAMLLISVVPKVEAGFVPSELTGLSGIDRTKDMDKIQQILETKMIQQRLEKLGFTQDEISSRLSHLSDQQIHQLALQLDELRVGSDGLGVVIALLVIAILVVLLLNLTGRRVIVTK